MEKKEERVTNEEKGVEDIEEAEAIELVLFQVSECYVYLVKIRLHVDARSKSVLFFVYLFVILL